MVLSRVSRLTLAAALAAPLVYPFFATRAEEPTTAATPDSAKIGQEGPPNVAVGQPEPVVTLGSRVQPKPLAVPTQKALAYLISQQDASGGWGQGGGWRQNSQGSGRVEGTETKDPPDLGNTCIAALALIRAGNTPQSGQYANQLSLAVKFICSKVDAADNDGLYVTDVRDTQLQQKIGQFVDTFLAGLVLSELKGKMPAGEPEQRLMAALTKTVRKIEKNQKEDGTFTGNTGWASVLSQGLASKFINRAVQNKVAVSDEVLRRDYYQSVAGLDRKTGEFKVAAGSPTALPAEGRLGLSSRVERSGAAGDAGVQLYSFSANAGRISDNSNTNVELERVAKATLAKPAASDEEKKKAEADLKHVADVRGAREAAAAGIVRQLDDPRFVSGFGNNGGEEFLSYMNISEMLAAKGGQEWERWDKAVTSNLERIQNKDGSWSGHHCITGRTFCTSAALLTLMADRAPVPLAEKIKAQQSSVQPQANPPASEKN